MPPCDLGGIRTAPGEQMEITANLRTFLLNDTDITLAFGARLYVAKAPDNPEYPFGIIRKVAPFPMYSQDGRWGNDDIVQIDVYDAKLFDCIAAVQLIEERLDGYRGQMGSIPETVSFITQTPVEEWSPEVRHYRSRLQVQIKWTAYG